VSFRELALSAGQLAIGIRRERESENSWAKSPGKPSLTIPQGSL